MSETTSFPIVSFQPFLSGNPESQIKVAQELYDAFHTYGWVYLKDFGISEAEIDDMFAHVCGMWPLRPFLCKFSSFSSTLCVYSLIRDNLFPYRAKLSLRTSHWTRNSGTR